MPNNSIKNCPRCNQQLSFPENVGGIVMVCPSCGHKFNSNFKLGSVNGHPVSNKRKSKTECNRKKLGSGLSVIA